MTPSLTVNLGVRWETDSPIVDANNRMNGFDPNQINPVSGTPGVVKFLAKNGFRSKPYGFDGNNFGPRFGFAWKIAGSSKTVLRAGYGIFFSHPFDSGQPNTAALGFSNMATLNTPDNGLTAPFYLRTGVPVYACRAGAERFVRSGSGGNATEYIGHLVRNESCDRIFAAVQHRTPTSPSGKFGRGSNVPRQFGA